MTPAENQRHIWGVMSDWGYRPQWTELLTQGGADYIAMGFDMIGNKELPWTKAFMLDAVNATPALFRDEIRAFKKKIRCDLASNDPSPVVRQVAQAYGMDRLRKAIAI